MEREQVKRILLFCRDIDGEISINKRLIQDWEDCFYRLSGGGTLDGASNSKYKKSNPTEKIVLNIPKSLSESMQNLHKEIDQLAALQTAILQELNKLPLSQKSILYDFYIKGLRWVQVSEHYHYSERHCKNIRNHALDKLAKRFSQNITISDYDYPL